MTANLLIKLFKLEYYFDKPLGEFELPYSELIGRTYSRLPVIRCFGSSPAGSLCNSSSFLKLYFALKFNIFLCFALMCCSSLSYLL